MTPSTTLINRDQPWCPRYGIEEIGGRLRSLPPDQRCLIQDFRDYAWVNFVLPSDEFELECIAKTFGHSRYKFRKNWPLVKKFFMETDAGFFFQQDEEHRIAAREKMDKFKAYGTLGASVKKERQAATPIRPEKISTEFSTAPLQQQQQQTELDLKTYTTATVVETSGIEAMAEAVGAAAAEQTQSNQRKPPEREESREWPESQKLIASCRKFSDVTPGFVEKLAEAARAVQPDIDDGGLCDAIRATFKREKQESAGLWLHTVPAWLRNRKAAATA